MHRLFALVLILAPLTVLADAAQEVRCREIGFSHSAEEGDTERFASFIDPDARFVGGTVRRGVAEITEGWGVFFTEGGPHIKWRPQIVEVLESGDLALSRGPFRMTSIDAAGYENEVWGTFNSVWRRQLDGEWKVVFDAGSNEPETPSEEARALLDQPDTCPGPMLTRALGN